MLHVTKQYAGWEDLSEVFPYLIIGSWFKTTFHLRYRMN